MTQEEHLEIRPWKPSEDLTPIRRFWYDIYVTEMGRHVDTADHERRELNDERAEIGEIIVARKGDAVVGTLICTPSWTNALGDYEKLYHMKKMGALHPCSTAIITKLMVSPEYRHTTLSVRISCELYRHAVPMGVHHPVIDCNDHLVPLFERIGFKRWTAPFDHPEYGNVNVLKLDCLDLEHLEAVRSPLLPVARRIAPPILNSLHQQPKKGALA